MSITKAERLAKIHYEALVEFDSVQSALRDERLQCLSDRRFYSVAGAQWEGPLGEQFENKPKFEVNKIHLAVIRIINEYRNNRITVNFLPKDGRKNDQLADACNGLYRADETDSGADEAKDNGFEEAVGGGFGAWRLRCVYEDETDGENERQRIRIEPIFDADSSVFYNLDAKRQDKADAKRCWVLTSMTHEAYKAEYKEDPASWPKTVHQWEFDWYTPDVVFVCEHYRIEETAELLVTFTGLDDQEIKYREPELEGDPSIEDQLTATGFRRTGERKIKRLRVHKYLMDGARVIRDEGYIAGQCIPIVPNYGKRWFVDNVERCMGHVRLAKDAQRLKNMQLSKLGEISALGSVEKPVLSPEEIGTYGTMWSEDNIKNYPYLLKNKVLDAQGNPVNLPMEYTRVPTIPPAMAALLQLTEEDMQDLLGNQQAGEEMQSNISGIAVELIQQKLDMQTFIYMSNMAKAVKRTGEIWLSMAKDILVEPGRIMKTVDAQGEVDSIEILKPVVNEKTGKQEYENDFANANFDVSVEVGPSSASKRSATVRALTGMVQLTDDPDTKQVLGAMAMLNMEGEGIQEVRDYFRHKLIKLGVIKPTKEEQEELGAEAAATPPDPQAEFLKASGTQALAQADKATADAELSRKKAILTEAQVVETMAKAGNETTAQIVATVSALGEAFNAPEPAPAAA